MNKKIRFVCRVALLIGFLGAGACLIAMDTQQKQPFIKQEIVDPTEDNGRGGQIDNMPPVVQLQQQPVHQTKRRSVDDLSPVEIHAITGDIYALVDNQIRRNQEFDYGDIAQLCTTKYHLAFPQTLDGFVLNKLGLQPPNDMLKLGLGGLLKQQQKLRKLIFDYYTSFPRCTQLALCTHLVEKGYVFNKEQIPSLLVRVELDDLIALDDLQQKLGPPQALQAPRDIIPVNENNKNKGVRKVTGDHRRGTTKEQKQPKSLPVAQNKKSGYGGVETPPKIIPNEKGDEGWYNRCRRLTKKEKDAIIWDIVTFVMVNGEKTDSRDICDIGENHGIKNIKNVTNFLNMLGLPNLCILRSLTYEKLQKILNELKNPLLDVRAQTEMVVPIVPEKNVVEQKSIFDKKLKKPSRRCLGQGEREAIALDLAICIYEKKEKIENDDIRAIGKKYGFLNIINVAAFLRRFNFPCVTVLQKLFSEQRWQKLFEELGFPEERLRALTKTLQPLAFVGRIVENRIENKRIREIEEEKHDTTQGSTNLGQELDKTPHKKIKVISPQQKSGFNEEMIFNQLNGGNRDDLMAGGLFEEQEEKTPRFMFENIKDLSEENGEKIEQHEDKEVLEEDE